MACGCSGGNQNANQVYIFVNSRGEQTTYRSEVEARAAQIRAGGEGRIETKAA
jgi:hypothetical protein